jgi:hypothetical protein
MTGTLRVAQYRDIHEDMRLALIKSGPIYESAQDEALQLFAKDFRLVGDTWIKQDTQQSLAEWILEYRETRPHCFADRDLDGEQLEQQQIDDAMLNPTPGKVTVLAKMVGPRVFEKIVKDYGFDVARMKAGTRPEYAADGKTVVPRKADAKNPWSAAGWNITAQGSIIKSLGPEKAASIARAAGCQIGATRPNPNYNK